MLGPMFSALSGLSNASKRLQNSANNIANVNTAGFKKSDVNSVENKSGGTRVNDISKSNTQGSLVPTGNPLDLAIDGDGFFQVTNPNGGTSFTRSGSFKQDGAGNIVDASGNALVPAINIPGNNTGISVGANGQVSAQVGGHPEAVGQITLARFQNPSGLTAAGGNLYNESAGSGAPVVGNPGAGGLGTVRSGFLEGSNVDITEEIVDQIVSKVAFKANVNVIKANDEMLGSILDIKT
ncbi:MAG: flagellar hook-basal body complex protein [Nitrospinae bacterium]|nr:flagellar hook-basal body complex protein [Nitrospinota bacterium]MBL7021622.1 flagellar hook-basal body complex protein [Nitrospinaceae bacterium]